MSGVPDPFLHPRRGATRSRISMTRASAEGVSTRSVTAALRSHLRDPRCGFSIGAMGAIAEFHRDPDEPVTIENPRALTVESERGAIRLTLPAGVRPLAYEIPSRRPERWQQGIVFCLPSGRVAKRRPSALSEIGPDRDAIRAGDRDAILFDLGLGLRNADFCIRVADPDLLAILRRAAGRPVFAPGNTVLLALVAASPHRVVKSELGRIEVYQAIDTTATPRGPHTHLLPDLMRSRRIHPTTIPVPAGWIPCLSLYPPDPLSDGAGRERPFDRRAFSAFQRLLLAWGDRDYVAEKMRFSAAVEDQREAGRYRWPTTRSGRMAIKVALRQMRHVDPASPALAVWSRRFGRGH